MTDFRIEVIIDPAKARAGARAVRGELDRTEDRASKLGGTLKRAFQIIGVGLIVRELGQLADAYTNAQNRLRTVVDGEAELVAVTEELFEIANRTRSSFEGSAEVYARVALATKDLGVTQQETLQFTESLNQAVILSGASAAEAQAGLMQLSQGMASGTLRGDELRAVLEQLPAVADVIAKSLGVTRGELRKMSEDGKITAGVVIDAFAQAREELAGRFAKSIPTLSQGFQVLKNDVLKYVGETNKGLGVTAALASGMIFAGENVELLGSALLVVATSALPAMIIAVKALIAQSTILRTIIASGIFSPIVLGTAAAGAGIILLVDQYVEAQKRFAETGAKATFLTRFESDLTLINRAITNTEKNMARVQVQIEKGLVPKDIGVESVTRLNQRLDELNQQWLRLSDGSNTSLRALQQQEKAAKALDSAAGLLIVSLDEEARLLKLDSREREIQIDLLKQIKDLEKGTKAKVTEPRRAELEASLRGNQALREQAEVLDALKSPQEKFQRRLEVLSELEGAGKISLEKLNQELVTFAANAAGLDLGGATFTLPDPKGFDDIISRLTLMTAKQKELKEQEGFRAQVLQDIKGPAQELAATEAALGIHLRTNKISQEEHNKALEAAKEKVRLLNPEYAAQRDLLKELQAPLLDLETRLKSLTVLYVTGEIGLAKYALETAKAREAIRLLNPEYAAQKELLNEILGPAKAIEEQQRRLTELWLRGALSTSEYAAALKKTRDAMVALNPEQAAHKALLEEIHGPAKELADRQRRLTEEWLVGGITLSEYATQMGKVKAALTAMNPQQQLQADILASINAPQKQLIATQAALNALLNQGKISAESYTLAMNNAAIAANVLGSSAATGLAAGLAQIENQLLDVGGTVQETIVNGFNAGQDALVDFVRTGTADFQQFVDVILDGLAKLLVQQALLALFPGGGAVGSFFAGAFGGGRAGGGDVRPGQAYVVGEKGPELFTPANPGNIVPAGETAAMLSGNMAPTINITAPPAQVNVINVRDPSEIPRGIQSAEGKQAVLNVIHEKRQTIRGAIG